MSQPLYIAFVWHMHQPYYRDLASGACSMPWVRLHATKDYLDMVKILEPFPAVHQTFNVVPSLLDQLEEYLPPSNRSDEFLDISNRPAAQLSEREQRFILQWFFLAHPERMIKPYPRYHDLLVKRGAHVAEHAWPALLRRFKTQDYLDLQVWFNLAWIDPWLRAQDAQLVQLQAQGGRFTEEQKRYVLQQHRTLMAQVIPAYREAASQGQIELSASPYYHPIMPLLCDLRAAQMGLPHATLPRASFRYPEDARWQLREGLARHAQAFGQPTKGLWPPEGSVSEEFVALAIEAQLGWIATDEEILWRTLKQPRALSQLYRPHLLRRRAGQTAIVFRDRELSDLLGFVYSQWEARIAIDDFLKRLGGLHQQFRHAEQPPLITIILDGENAWECYQNDGHDFLTGLYAALAGDERFRCVTVSEFLQQHPMEHSESLPELFSGSWIDGNFATWIGHPEKNAAWEHLARAREALAHLDLRNPAHQQAWRSFAAAEGSDWMWWFGDTHFSANADEFDRLFRTHLANGYRLAGLEAPGTLQQPIRRPATARLHAPTGFLHPKIDGRETSYYEWLYAGRMDLRQQYAAMHRGQQCLRSIAYGFDEAHEYVRLDLDVAALRDQPQWSIVLAFAHAARIEIRSEQGTVQAFMDPPTLMGGGAGAPVPVCVPCGLERVLELAVPFSLLGVKPGDTLSLSLQLRSGQEVVERYPEQGGFDLATSLTDLEAHAWSV